MISEPLCRELVNGFEMGKLPTVAIVGRPNVGKSELFNRLVQRRIAIVHDQPGVTRDRLAADCLLGASPFTVVDTGGIGGSVGDNFEDQVRAEAKLAMESADVILFVVDARAGVNPIDRTLAQELHSTRKPVLLAVNKIDHTNQEFYDLEFAQLGFSAIHAISAAHSRGIGELVESIQEHLPEPLSRPESPSSKWVPIKLAVVGRPNVGKSSLLNAILQDQRTIVSSFAGTTRDSVDVPYDRGEKSYILIDTAGIRPRSKHNTSVEVFSVMRSEKSIERADLCALVIDAVDGVTSQDKKIAGLIQASEKPCLIAVNKLDLVKPPTRVRDFFDAVLGQIRANLFFLSYAPIDIISAQTGENLDRLFVSIEKIQKHAQKSIGTGQLNRLLQEAMQAHPPPVRGNRRLKLLYATQVDKNGDQSIAPPSFMLFVNYPELLTDDYRRYLEGKIREEHGYYGLPILFKLRSRH
jgi:GTPase